MADDRTAVAAAVDSAPVRALYAEAVRSGPCAGPVVRRAAGAALADPRHPDGHADRDDEVAPAIGRRRQLAGGLDRVAGIDLPTRDRPRRRSRTRASASRSRARTCPSARCTGRRRAAIAVSRQHTAARSRSTTTRSPCRRGRQRCPHRHCRPRKPPPRRSCGTCESDCRCQRLRSPMLEVPNA